MDLAVDRDCGRRSHRRLGIAQDGRPRRRVPVVHKHRFGSCEGSLAADCGVSATRQSNQDDAWTLTFGDLEKFALDYQGKTLRIKQRGGRTWNFTTLASNADPLLVFQREVDHARTRLTPSSGLTASEWRRAGIAVSGVTLVLLIAAGIHFLAPARPRTTRPAGATMTHALEPTDAGSQPLTDA